MNEKKVLGLLRHLGEPLTMSSLATALGAGRGDRDHLRSVVDTLVERGAIEKLGRRYALVPPEQRPAKGSREPAGPHAIGSLRVHPAGYGFVEREDGLGDVFVPAKYRGHALDGDRVQLYTWEGYKGTEGRVEEVLERGRAKLTGTLRRAGKHQFVEPDDPRISAIDGRIALDEPAEDSAVGQCVVVEITQYPGEAGSEIVGKVIRVLGAPEDPTTEIEKIIVCGDIPNEFSPAAMEQAKATPQEVTESDAAGRLDLRDKVFLTIDPETARDFDDALCVEQGTHGGLSVWVAVADVSHYVQSGDALDDTSRDRSVSVYLPDRVVPMLPFELSSGICSLNPEVDRCAMTVRMDFDADYKVTATHFAAALIRSRARLDYPGVAAVFRGDLRGDRARYEPYQDSIHLLRSISHAMRARRQGRGALELELPEPKVILDADDPRLVRDVVRSKADDQVKEAYQLVEEFMVAANEAVGSFFASRNLDTLWRVHAPPTESRLTELREALSYFDVRVDVEAAAAPRGIAAVLEELKGHPAERALSFLVLRSLKQAQYSVENVGHFGLASRRYIHFTSPIRRYPDLVVHRLMKAVLAKEGGHAGRGAELLSKQALVEVAATVSTHERRAMEAEREAVSLYRALLMREHIGEHYRASINAVTSFGLFVEFDNPFAEALAKYESLGDELYEFDREAHQLVGKRSGRTFRLGDTLTVEISGASIVKRQVSVKLVGGSTSSSAGSRKSRPRRDKPTKGRRPTRGASSKVRKKGGRKKKRGRR